MKLKKLLRNNLVFIIGFLLFIGSIFYFYQIYLAFYKPSIKDSETGLYELLSYKPPTDIMYLGKDNAPITILVYTGFECNACKEFNEELFPFLIENYVNTGKARYFHKWYFTEEDITSNSINYQKSKFLYCIQKINDAEFWKYYRLLFSEFPKIEDEEFKSCLGSGDNELRSSLGENFLFGITAEPTILIGIYGQNNVILSGVPTISQLSRTIKDKEIILGYE